MDIVKKIEVAALSVKQPWASYIATGYKTIETRTWYTRYRGPLLICSSKRPKLAGLPAGKALCFANMTECRKMTIRDQPAAKCEVYENAFSWVFNRVEIIEKFAVRGQLGIFTVTIPQSSVPTWV